jgi:PAS domain S-box-containing protein
MPTPERTEDSHAGTAWSGAAQAMMRAAQAVSHPGGPELFAHLVHELATILPADTVFVAVFTDDRRSELRTLAAVLDGQPLRNFDYPLEGSPCAHVVGHAFRHVASGVAAEFRPGTIFGAKGMDAYVAFPLNDSAGVPLGLLVAMDRWPIANAALAEALLKIFAGRMVAEIERGRADDALRAAALAVSSARGESVLAELVRYLAAILRVEMAFIARHEPDDPGALRIQAMVQDGHLLQDVRYEIKGTPCAEVLGQQFRAYPSRLRELFPDDHDAELQGTESYAGYPLHGMDGRPLGNISIASRQPLVHLDRIESMLQIFAVRAAAEIEQLQAREALQRSAASYRAIFDASEDAIFIHDWDSGAILDVNPKACATYGWTRDELKSLSVADVSSGVPPYTGEQALEYLQLAKLGRCPPFEWHRRNRDGSLHWDEVHLKPALIEGRPHILAFTRDITERKAALDALQAREQQYRAIFETASDGFVLWDEKLSVVDANPAALRLYGYTRDQVIGKAYPSDLPPSYVQERLQLVRRALAGETVQVETTALRARGDGSSFDIDLRVMPFRHRGQPHVLAVVRDISDRRERERELKRSEARLRATVEAAFDGVIGMDGEGRIVEFNAAAELCFGHRREDVLGQLLADVILPHRHRDAHARGLKHFHVTGRGPMVGRLVETTALRADGTEIPIELAISVAAVPEGSIFVGHLRDISARRAAEAERAALESQLRQAQKMEAIGQLTGGIAHDFNNILTSVLGYLVLGQERAQALGDARLLRQLGQAQLAAQRARDLIAQMLAFARRQRGERRLLALPDLLHQSLELLRPTLPASVVLDALAVDALKAGAMPPVHADAVQLEQVFFNLCINARDAMNGSGAIRVGLTTREGGSLHCSSCGKPVGTGRWVELRVADNGSGMPPDVLRRIFEPFFTTKEVGRGSGMGLAMVHGIVHEHGGHVVVETSLGEGTSFRVLLPAAEAAAVADADGTAAPALTPPRLTGRVLVVDDETMVGDFMAELLDGWGLQTVLMRDPQSALEWIADSANIVDLLITDQTMPQLTGLELARRCRALRASLPVLLYTGNPEAIDDDSLARAGVHALLPKPIEAEALRAALRRCLSSAA